MPESVIRKIDRCRDRLIQWTKENKTNNFIHIKEAQAALERALSADISDQTLINSIIEELQTAYINEKKFWSQRSRVNWLQCGDRNTSYFHAATRG